MLVVAYNAATTLAKTLDRIPDEVRDDIEEVIVSDDHSQDSTYLVGLGYQQISDLPITLIRQPKNLGYGGNQKAGYNLAIEHGLDIVVMLHGDGQYAPESMPDLLAPLLEGEADAVFGSRIMIKGAARQGGMPLYKYVGNRILSTVRERRPRHRPHRVPLRLPGLLGRRPEADPVRAEHRRLQLRHPDHHPAARCRHADRRGPDPHLLRRRDLLRRRHGLRRRRDQGRHRLPAAEGRLRRRQPDQPQRGVPAQALRGQLARPDLHDDGGPPAGQDPRPGLLERPAGRAAPGDGPPRHRGRRPRVPRRGRADERLLQADLAEGIPPEVGTGFDLILMADVLEHLGKPGELLEQCKDLLAPEGSIMLCVPNIGHWYPRTRATLGMFDYDQRGILDATHLRFFTRRSIRRLVERSGYTVRRMEPVGLPLDALGIEGTTARVVRLVDHFLVTLWPTLFGYQFIVEATPNRY